MYRSTYDKIDELLKERKMSRRKLAQKAGINVNTMSALFAKKPDVLPDKYLNPIAEVLEVSPTTLRASNLRLFTASEAVPFDANKINHAMFRSHAEQPPEADSTTEPTPQPMSFSRFCAALEAMDDEELELISLYLEHLRKKRGQ